ncbi:MAG: GNAT family N-acetyltransferase [Flavobacteriales bacterium]|jgi:ribosomal protein S18 acetylase RimI-like enzyme|nr:GNAT family N-acetyltransferase [Flavobacteriales bacterium]
MIIKIDNKRNAIAKEIRNIFQSSYAIEAEMLKAIDFPPLKRTISQFLNSNSEFYAYYLNQNIAGLIEIKNNQDLTHIQSLVVYPKYFRKGIGRKLVQFVLGTYKSIIFTVETGVDNYPAIKLYISLGFEEQNQWDTNHGIRKVKFKK